MKAAILFVGLLLCISPRVNSQYTPLPPLDHKEYEQFVSMLKTQAIEQEIPELNTIAENMSYDEARRFLLNPHLFSEKLKQQQADTIKPTLPLSRMGIVVNFLLNYISNLDGTDYESPLQVGYAIGLYALFSLGKNFLLTELQFLHRTGKIEYDGTTDSVIKINYITLVTNFLYRVSSERRIYIGIGPILAVGVSGKEKLTNNGSTNEFDREFGDDGLEQFQGGISFRIAGMLDNSMLIYLGYNLMLSEVQDGSSWKLHSFLAGVTIPFGLFK